MPRSETDGIMGVLALRDTNASDNKSVSYGARADRNVDRNTCSGYQYEYCTGYARYNLFSFLRKPKLKAPTDTQCL